MSDDPQEFITWSLLNRISYKRMFRFTNPLLADKFLTAWQEDGRPKVSFRQRITDRAGHDAYFGRNHAAPSAVSPALASAP